MLLDFQLDFFFNIGQGNALETLFLLIRLSPSVGMTKYFKSWYRFLCYHSYQIASFTRMCCSKLYPTVITLCNTESKQIKINPICVKIYMFWTPANIIIFVIYLSSSTIWTPRPRSQALDFLLSPERRAFLTNIANGNVFPLLQSPLVRLFSVLLVHPKEADSQKSTCPLHQRLRAARQQVSPEISRLCWWVFF